MECIGIDVAKAQLECAGLPSGETGTAPNSDEGIPQLVPILHRLPLVTSLKGTTTGTSNRAFPCPIVPHYAALSVCTPPLPRVSPAF
jgi:hypothetical protein